MALGRPAARALPKSPRTLIRRLEALKERFAADDTEAKLAVLAKLRETEILDPKVLLRYHEALLFIRAHPDDRGVFRLACRECREFGSRVDHLRAVDPDAAWDLEDTGIVHTGMYYNYDYAVVIWLVRWYGDVLDIDWEAVEATDAIDRLLPLLCEWIENDGLDLADISTRDWIDRRRGKASSLRWLLENLERSIPSYAHRMQLYDSLELPVVWQLGDSPAARTHAGSPSRRPYYHQDGLLKRISDFKKVVRKPLDAIELASRRAAGSLIKTLRSTLSVRHRALYPIDYANRDEVLVADVGRGYQIILYGMVPERRLPIESDYGVMVLKNGFVFGYGVGAMLFDQVEIAVNIFETWRGGESRYVFAQFVRTFCSHFGCRRCKIERYQVGYDNDEGIRSGSFWFYYHLGFVPKVSEVRELARREQAKIDRDRSYRSPVSVLKRLAESDLYLTVGGKETSFPEDFPVADLSLRTTRMIGETFDGNGRRATQACAEKLASVLECRRWHQWPRPEQESFRRLSLIVAQIADLDRWTRDEREQLVAIMRAKGRRREAEYARLTAGHQKLRRALERVARS